MRLTDVVTATTPDRLYSDFIPAFITCWKALIPEIRIWILFVGKEIPEHLQEYSQYLVLFPAPQGVHPGFVSQMVRLLFPGTLSGEGVVLITELDKLSVKPNDHVYRSVSRSFLVHKDSFDSEGNRVEPSYCLALPETWKSIFICDGEISGMIEHLRDVADVGAYLYQKVMDSGVQLQLWDNQNISKTYVCTVAGKYMSGKTYHNVRSVFDPTSAVYIFAVEDGTLIKMVAVDSNLERIDCRYTEKDGSKNILELYHSATILGNPDAQECYTVDNIRDFAEISKDHLCECRVPDNEHHYISTDGTALLNNMTYHFVNRFDWIYAQNVAIKKKPLRADVLTIYIKIDFLTKNLPELLQLTVPFILVTGCGDCSPVINYFNDYAQIIRQPYLVRWYGENIGVSDHPKVYPLTVGLYHPTIMDNVQLTDIHCRTETSSKKNKIFSCFRMRTTNCCGGQYLERPHAHKLIDRYPDRFDVYHDVLKHEFYETLAGYRWCFCPLGNGMDHSPKLLECLIVKTIPICRKTPNSYRLYKEYPIIWIEDFDVELGDLDTFDSYDWCKIIEEFSQRYWFEKITGV